MKSTKQSKPSKRWEANRQYPASALKQCPACGEMRKVYAWWGNAWDGGYFDCCLPCNRGRVERALAIRGPKVAAHRARLVSEKEAKKAETERNAAWRKALRVRVREMGR